MLAIRCANRSRSVARHHVAANGSRSANSGGKSASAIVASVGVTLTYAQRQPGSVCRVNGAPASDPCVNASPANAYWGLWWADGSQASWTYSSYGAGGLTVPSGGSVGFSWQQDRPAGGTVPPGVAPPVPGVAPADSAVLHTLAEIVRSIVEQRDINDILHMILEGLLRTGGYDGAFLALVTVARDRIVGRMGSGPGIER